MSDNTNPFENVGLTFIEVRLQELADNLPDEMDLDTEEVLFLQQAIVLCESEMTAERAFELKKNLDLIERFVQDQKETLKSLLHGVSMSKRGRRQYGQNTSQARSRFVYRKA